MKLGDIKGDRCFDVVADLVGPVSNIALDTKSAELFKRKKVPEGKDTYVFFVERLKDGLPALLRDHKEDFISIMAALSGVDRGEYVESLNLAKLFADVFTLLTDEEFLAFLS